jgi:hypothetical protein
LNAAAWLHESMALDCLDWWVRDQSKESSVRGPEDTDPIH